MLQKKPYVIAETAYSFEGDFKYLLEQTEKLPEDVDAIKYHMIFNLDEYIVPSHSVYPLLKSWILKPDEWNTILSTAKQYGHDVIVLADDRETFSFLKDRSSLVDGIEIHAACVNDKGMLDLAIEFSKRFNKTLYIGVSGFEVVELFDIHTYIVSHGCTNLVFMYGFQNYPTKVEDIQLNKIPLLREMFNVPVGYADHTGFDEAGKTQLIETAYALGANIQEIHYVIDEGEKRTDSVTALSANSISKIKEGLDLIYKAIGTCDLRLNDGEKKYLNFRKVAAYTRDLKKGSVLQENDFRFIRVENPKCQHKFSEEKTIIGRTVSKDVSANCEIELYDLI